MKRRLSILAIIGCALLVAACNKPPAPTSPQAPALPGKLAGTSWQLVEFQSPDTAVGVVAPADPSKYQMMLGADGTASLKLDCNQASGAWAASGDDSGSFGFGTLAMTKAFCPPPSLSDQIAQDSASVQSYQLHDGKLSLSLGAGGGTYLWEPL